ncbi:hypothetical protein P5V15_005468 [Pogonomyrmex californicus]
MEEAYKGRNGESLQNYITLADMTRPARFRLEDGSSIPTDSFCPHGGSKIPGMGKQRRNRRNVEKIMCDDDVRAAERGCWRYSWRQTLDDLDEPVIRCCGCWDLEQ